MLCLKQRSLRLAFLLKNGLFWVVSVAVLLYVVSAAARWQHVLQVLGTTTVRELVVTVACVAYCAGFVGCLAGTRINRVVMMSYLCISSVGIIGQIALLGILFLRRSTMDGISYERWVTIGGFSRSIVQSTLSCCGYEDNTHLVESGPVDLSCFKRISQGDVTLYRHHPIGCRYLIIEFLHVYWLPLRVLFVLIVAVQVFGLVTGVRILRQTRRLPTVDEQPADPPRLSYQFQRHSVADDSSPARDDRSSREGDDTLLTGR